MNLTKTVLKRPVTTVLCVLCLMVFGFISLFSSKMELTPEMNMPMMVISTVYVGASPEDVDELLTKPIEDEVGQLSGVDSLTSVSSENSSLVLLQYDYGTDMDKAYSDLKKKVDALESSLPEDAMAPMIMEFDVNSTPSMMMAVNNCGVNNLYNYVNDTIVPELEKIPSVASVELSGGQKEYVRIQLIPEKLAQYHLSINSVATAVSNASFSIPSGSTEVGSQELNVSAGVTYETVDSLKEIPITTPSGDIVYLDDVAVVGNAVEEASSIGRYNGRDTISVSIQKQQKSSAQEVSREVSRVMDKLEASDENLDMVVVYDANDQIEGALSSVFETMIMAVAVSMVIIFLFFGDIKASLIVGTSIPISIMAALVLMYLMGFSLNVITMSALVLGVGMMVDNSIVVLESCFRATKGNGFREYRQAAIDGSGIVLQSIIGSTATTCVVFLPLALLSGMSGQMFKPLGFTIIFCMAASLVSAMTIVPLCYAFYHPRENSHAPASRIVAAMQRGYRDIMESILPKKKMVMFGTIGMLVLSFMMASQLRSEMIPATDEGTIAISVDMRPGVNIEKAEGILSDIETAITADEDLDSYMLTYSGNGGSITAYLKDDRKRETSEVTREWKSLLSTMDDCNITVQESSTMSSFSMGDTYQVILQSTQYDELKEVSDKIAEELKARKEIAKVHTSLENAAPVVKLHIDSVKAGAEGLTPAMIAGTVNQILSGADATTLEVDGNEVDVRVEYPADDYKTIDQLESIMLTNPSGGTVALTDVADVVFEDSPASISRSDKQYQVTISAEYAAIDESGRRAARIDGQLFEEVVKPNLTQSVSVATNDMMEMMNEEFSALGQAILLAAFLVFVVMAAQFESPKFSFMVMTTIPFSLIGSFGLLWLADVSISMPSLLGFLMLVGTVVNNGILYVDTVNQYRATMDIKTALIEAGATRLRPILMTTLTTIVAMIPMALAFGESGEMMQGLGLVNVGGLVASTVLSLLMLPVYYSIMNRKRKAEPDYD
ncbi:MAG: efflux RND transporter permease subunit [Lachnospiraceae bacterium]